MSLISSIKSLQCGQLVMVETLREVLIGNLKQFDVAGKILELQNVRDFKSSYAYTSSQFVPVSFIKTVKIVGDDDETETNSISNSNSTEYSTASSCASASPRHSKVEKIDISAPLSSPASHQTNNETRPSSVILSNRELWLIQEQLTTTAYIYQTDQLYHKALADIKTQAVISIVLDPMQFGRHNRTSLLAVGTHRTVYIFDIIMIGKVFSTFKEILESKRPRKVLHYSHRIADNLQHRQNIKLAGVFDTFVAHCLLANTKTHITLLETIHHYLSIPELYFTAEGQTENDMNKFDPYRRPVSKQHIQLLAKLVILQYKLYEHLLHEQMLANFYQQCEEFSNTYISNTDGVEVAFQMKPHSREGFHHIRPQKEWKEYLDKRL